jgi:CBS domain-containing protein
MRVIDVLRANSASLLTVAADRTLGEAIALMAARRVGSVVATDAAGRPLGIVTEPDVVRALAAGGGESVSQYLRRIIRAPAPT